MFILASAKSLKIVKSEPGESLSKWNAIEVFLQFRCTVLELDFGVGRPFWININAVELLLSSSTFSFSTLSLPLSAAIFGAIAAQDLSSFVIICSMAKAVEVVLSNVAFGKFFLIIFLHCFNA